MNAETPNLLAPLPRPLFMVDDDPDDRVLFQRLVAQSRVSNPPRVFTSGEEMIDALIDVLRGAPAPLACFVDVRMPGMNGFDVLRWIRCQHALDVVPVVMLSASEELRDLQEAHHSGAQCYLGKFPSPEQFRDIVAEAERVAAASPETAFKFRNNLLSVSTPAAC